MGMRRFKKFQNNLINVVNEVELGIIPRGQVYIIT
jgi:hypothetical protein